MKASVAIDRHIPLPEHRSGRHVGGRNQHHKYPFLRMEVGDSFFVGVKRKSARHGKRDSLRAQARAFTPFRFVTRLVPNGVRVWRAV